MKITTMLSYSGGFRESAAQVAEFEKAGLDLVWVAEAYGFDAPSLMGYLAAKTERVRSAPPSCPIYTRTPTLIAMTAAGIDALSGGRCELGLGASGPPGHRGLPRRALRPPRSAAPARSSRSAARCGPARRRSTHEGDVLHPPAARRTGHRAGQGRSRSSATRCARHPDLGGRAGREERGHDGRGGRRLDADLLRAREGEGRVGIGTRRRRGQARPGARAAADRRRRHAGHRRGDEVAAIRELARPHAGPLHRRHGRQGSQLLQRPGLPLRLREGGREDPGPLPGRARRRRRRPRSPTSCSSRRRCAGPRATSRSASPPSPKRASPISR